jgi:hypothetical protein
MYSTCRCFIWHFSLFRSKISLKISSSIYELLRSNFNSSRCLEAIFWSVITNLITLYLENITCLHVQKFFGMVLVEIYSVLEYMNYFFYGTGVWTQDFVFAKQVLTKQVLYCLNHASGPFWSSYFELGSHKLFSQTSHWLQPHDLSLPSS